MPVTDFECQIARGQIDRYLGGGLLSPTALSGLEEHLGECAACKKLVSERRAALLGKLNGETPTQAVVSMPKKQEENPLIAALRAKSEEAQPQVDTKPAEASKAKTSPRYAGSSEKPSKPILTKPIMLAGLLGIVLVGMNTMSRANGGKGVMGGKAAESFASESLAPTEPKAAPVVVEKPVTTPKPNSKPVVKVPAVPAPVKETPKAAAPEATVEEKPVVEKTEVQQPAPEKTVEPIAPKAAAVRPIAVKPTAHRVVRRKPAARKRFTARKKSSRKVALAPRGGVRVYGLDGQPLK
jgi:anti-sigma factor RsiW